jgi:hypothetical protein
VSPRRAADTERPVPLVREVIVAAARAGRRNAGRIVAAAIVVSAVASAVEMIVHAFMGHANLTVSVLADLGTSSVDLLGVVFLSGFLARLAGEAEHGGNHVSVAEVLRTLPWGRLIRGDVLVVVIVVLGLIALIIPGLVAIVYLAVVGPVIEIENRPAVAALRRSAHLVRQRVWVVVLLAMLPTIASSQIPTTFPHSASAGALLAFLGLRVGEALVEAALGLVLVELCYRLIALDAAPPAASLTVRSQPRPGAPLPPAGPPGPPAHPGHGD